MERLSDNAIEIINALHTEKLDYRSEYLPLIEAANLLAAYEDTGLTPEEISDAVWRMSPVCIGCDGKTREGGRTDKCGYLAGNFSKCMAQSRHLADLKRAEQEGRLVVLYEPRLPLIWGDADHNTILCPNCERDLMGGFELTNADEMTMFQCPHCGQPIDCTKVGGTK